MLILARFLRIPMINTFGIQDDCASVMGDDFGESASSVGGCLQLSGIRLTDVKPQVLHIHL